MECCTTETLQRHVVTMNIKEKHHPAMSAVVDVFTKEQQTTNVAMVTIDWYHLVECVAKTTVVPYILVMETLVVMGNHIIITPSIVYVV